MKPIVLVLAILLVLLCRAEAWEDTLVGAWLFDDPQGITATDASGNGHDGAIKGAKWVPGKIGMALEFDGAGNIVEVAHDEAFDLTTYTVSAWIRTQPTGRWQTVIGKEPVLGHPRNYGVFIAGDTKLLGVNYTTGGDWKTAFSETIAADGKWHHVAASYDGKVLRAYLDGDLEGETKTDIPPDHNTEPIRIGRWGAPRGDFMEGALDEVAIFREAFTEDEIRDITMNIRDALSVSPLGRLTLTWGALKRF